MLLTLLTIFNIQHTPAPPVTPPSQHHHVIQSALAALKDREITLPEKETITQNQEVSQEELTDAQTAPTFKEEIVEEAVTYVDASDPYQVFLTIAQEKGLTASEIEGWSYIIQRESNWDIYATNPSSGAYGLPQSLPGYKMSTHGNDWQHNPRTQLLWMYDYMVSRYGSIQGAVNFWQANHWY